MKTNTKTTIYLPMVGMILTAALALPAAAQVRQEFASTASNRTGEQGRLRSDMRP